MIAHAMRLVFALKMTELLVTLTALFAIVAVVTRRWLKLPFGSTSMMCTRPVPFFPMMGMPAIGEGGVNPSSDHTSDMANT